MENINKIYHKRRLDAYIKKVEEYIILRRKFEARTFLDFENDRMNVLIAELAQG